MRNVGNGGMGMGVYEKALYLSLSFIVKLKFFKKIKFSLKKNLEIIKR